MKWAYVLSGLLASGCGGDGYNPGPDAAPAVDAPPHPIVGRWEKQPLSNNPNAPAPVVTFEASGTYREDANTGTWKLVGDQLDITYSDGRDEIGEFYLSPDRQTLLTQALLPVSTTTGVVGMWRGRYQVVANTPVQATFAFRSDGTVTWSETRPAGTRTDDGVWMIDGTLITASFTLGGTTPVQIGMRAIPDIAIGTYLHERLP